MLSGLDNGHNFWRLIACGKPELDIEVDGDGEDQGRCSSLLHFQLTWYAVHLC